VAIHEAAHATLDPQFHGSINRSKWNKAIKADNKFVSRYANNFPKREDIAETIIWWIAVRCKSDRISKLAYKKIILGIPNRLKYLDEQNYDTYPLVCK
jgi:nickel-dependent lactate racemase